jgi:hypothetical protein
VFMQINKAKLLYQGLLRTTSLDVGVREVTAFLKSNFVPYVTIFEVPYTRGISLAPYEESPLPLPWPSNPIIKPQGDLKYGVVSLRSFSHN